VFVLRCESIRCDCQHAFTERAEGREGFCLRVEAAGDRLLDKTNEGGMVNVGDDLLSGSESFGVIE